MSKKITEFVIARNGAYPAFKSPAILVHVEPNILEPILYFRKPSYLSDTQFRAVIEDISSQIKGLSKSTIEILEADS